MLHGCPMTSVAWLIQTVSSYHLRNSYFASLIQFLSKNVPLLAVKERKRERTFKSNTLHCWSVVCSAVCCKFWQMQQVIWVLHTEYLHNVTFCIIHQPIILVICDDYSEIQTNFVFRSEFISWYFNVSLGDQCLSLFNTNVNGR